MSSWFYRDFEDRYRGSRSIIRDRLAVYLPFVQPLAEPGAIALDLGCGRGEWIELLGEAGFAAEGVDLDEGMLAACRERGLTVTNGDAIAVLRARPEGSVAVVSAFHLVEHIPFEHVQTLIAEALRVLRPGGLLVLETPNPENLVVGASSFYDDPSHLRPLPPKLLAFAVEHGGFARHNVLRLQEAAHLHGAEPVQLFDVLAGVSPDYAVVAQKAGAPAHLAVLDALFARTYGLDLHVLAQRHQQAQDAVRNELVQVREHQAATGLAVQDQLAGVDAQIAHVHATTMALATDIAHNESTRAALAEQLERLASAQVAELATARADIDRIEVRQASADERIGRVDAILADIAARIGRLEATQESATLQVRQVLAAQAALDERSVLDGAAQAQVSERLGQIEAAAQLAQTAAQLRSEHIASRLRSRVAQLQELHEGAVNESARLAQHVAWVESRLTHAEADTAALRQQMAELSRRRAGFGVRVADAIGNGRRRLAGQGSGAHLRQPASTLARRVVQSVLRRPLLKRAARRLVAHFPRLHTRLLQLMYAPGAAAFSTPVDADPLASEMSPRSLLIYRALRGTSKPKD